MGEAVLAAMDFLLEPMRPDDWEIVRAIYLAGLSTGHASFETSAPTWEKWDAKYLRDYRFVARSHGGTHRRL